MYSSGINRQVNNYIYDYIPKWIRCKMKGIGLDMKHQIDKKILAIGLTALGVIILSVSFIYLLFNGSLFYKGIKEIVTVSMPVFYGMILAYLLAFIMNYVEEKWLISLCKPLKIKVTPKSVSKIRILSIAITLVLSGLFIYIFMIIVVPRVYESLQNITASFPVYIDNLVRYIEWLLVRYPEIEDYILNVMNEYSDKIYEAITQILPTMNELIRNLSKGIIGFLATLWDILIGLIIGIYILANKERFGGQAKKILYAIYKTERANNILSDIRFVDKTFGGFLSGKILDSFIIGIICFVCLQFIGTPYPVLISVIVGFTNIIPFFGPFIGAIPSALLILMVDPIQCLYFVIFVFLLQQFDGNFLGPKILGDSTGLPSGFWVIFSITIFGGLFGFAGMIFGVPLCAVVYAFVKRAVKKRLKQKDYPTSTEPYINLKEVADKSEFIMFDKSDAKYLSARTALGIGNIEIDKAKKSDVK